METSLNDTESLLARIKQLEHERDELRKDIEQLCMQQAGPSILVWPLECISRAGLEQEIENLRKELAACTRHNQNLQEELCESYRIKTQLADLHREEAAKNVEAEKQVKFFQGCVAAAFAERDHAILKAEKAKEKEELMAQKYNEFQTRLSTSYEIRQETLGELEDASLDEKCACLLNDPAEGGVSMILPLLIHSGKTNTSSLEAELERVRRSVDDLRNKLRMITSGKMILNRVTELRIYHSEHKIQIMNLLDMERSHIKRFVDAVEEKIRQFDPRGQNVHSVLKPDEDELVDVLQCVLKTDEDGCVAVHISTDAEAKLESKSFDAKACDFGSSDFSGGGFNTAETKGDASVAFHKHCKKRDLLDSNTAETTLNASEALARHWKKRVMLDLNTAETKGDASEALHRHYKKSGCTVALSQQEERHLLEKNVNAALQKKIDDFIEICFKLRIENATLKESMESIELLTSTVHRLRLSLLKVTELINSKDSDASASETLDEIITEAKLVKTALGSSLPVSWSAEGDGEPIGDSIDCEASNMLEDSGSRKIDSVSAAGFEMLDLLTLAAQILKENPRTCSSSTP
ncbi:Myosin heavy chain-related protein, putative isoform 3 [Hibiscus syriacus]|uniref:Myosin heavy chain-related protein, putative isoform 3 n=2 Tax=Hibiscus syriacus TaxID=106335 RepID=A0A6A2WLS3_HIBSY|nr:Myosin heavy chain-related protein, putative isoform 3 [Hibiscus syriacus]